MSENPNSKIIKKINNSSMDEAIKGFLKEALIYENQMQTHAKKEYTAKYNSLIRKYASKWR